MAHDMKRRPWRSLSQAEWTGLADSIPAEQETGTCEHA